MLTKLSLWKDKKKYLTKLILLWCSVGHSKQISEGNMCVHEWLIFHNFNYSNQSWAKQWHFNKSERLSWYMKIWTNIILNLLTPLMIRLLHLLNRACKYYIFTIDCSSRPRHSLLLDLNLHYMKYLSKFDQLMNSIIRVKLIEHSKV